MARRQSDALSQDPLFDLPEAASSPSPSPSARRNAARSAAGLATTAAAGGLRALRAQQAEASGVPNAGSPPPAPPPAPATTQLSADPTVLGSPRVGMVLGWTRTGSTVYAGVDRSVLVEVDGSVPAARTAAAGVLVSSVHTAGPLVVVSENGQLLADTARNRPAAGVREISLADRSGYGWNAFESYFLAPRAKRPEVARRIAMVAVSAVMVRPNDAAIALGGQDQRRARRTFDEAAKLVARSIEQLAKGGAADPSDLRGLLHGRGSFEARVALQAADAMCQLLPGRGGELVSVAALVRSTDRSTLLVRLPASVDDRTRAAMTTLLGGLKYEAATARAELGAILSPTAVVLDGVLQSEARHVATAVGRQPAGGVVVVATVPTRSGQWLSSTDRGQFPFVGGSNVTTSTGSKAATPAVDTVSFGAADAESWVLKSGRARTELQARPPELPLDPAGPGASYMPSF